MYVIFFGEILGKIACVYALKCKRIVILVTIAFNMYSEDIQFS